MARAVRLCPQLVIVRPDFREVQGGVAAGVRDLPRGDAAGRAAVARRGVSRRHRERLGRAARQGRWRERLKAADPGGDRADGVGRRRAEQVPREDRVGVEEAGRPDGHRARARRAASFRSCRSTRSGASARSPPRGCASAASSGWSTSARRTPSVLRDAVGSWRRLAAPARRRHRRPAGRAAPRTEVVGQREHLRAGPDRPQRDPRRRSTGWRATPRRGWRSTRCSAAPSRSRSATRTSRRSPAATPRTPAHATPRTSRSGPSSCWRRRRPASRPVRLLGVSVHNLEDPDGAVRTGRADAAV